MIEVTPAQFDTFKRHLPYGFQKQVFSAIIQDMCQMWDEFGDEFTRAIIAKNLTYRQFMDDYMERTHGYTTGPKEPPFFRNVQGGTITVCEGDQGIEEDED
jgi:hypothetical protein